MNNEKREPCKHRPRQKTHVLDPVTVAANTAAGEASRRRVYYFCDCGRLNKLSRSAFLKAA
jgi:hypothetical protein